MRKQIWDNSVTAKAFREDLKTRAAKKRVPVGTVALTPDEMRRAAKKKAVPRALTSAQTSEVMELLRQRDLQAGSIKFRVTERDINGDILEFEVVL